MLSQNRRKEEQDTFNLYLLASREHFPNTRIYKVPISADTDYENRHRLPGTGSHGTSSHSIPTISSLETSHVVPERLITQHWLCWVNICALAANVIQSESTIA